MALTIQGVIPINNVKLQCAVSSASDDPLVGNKPSRQAQVAHKGSSQQHHLLTSDVSHQQFNSSFMFHYLRHVDPACFLSLY